MGSAFEFGSGGVREVDSDGAPVAPARQAVLPGVAPVAHREQQPRPRQLSDKPLGPRKLIAQARRRIKELDREIRRIKALERERAELARLVGAANNIAEVRPIARSAR